MSSSAILQRILPHPWSSFCRNVAIPSASLLHCLTPIRAESSCATLTSSAGPCVSNAISLPARSFSTSPVSSASSSISSSSSLSHSASTAPSFVVDDSKYILGVYARFPVQFLRGSGAYLFDDKNRRYLDFYSGIAVNSLGHSDPEWLAALFDQAQRVSHVSNLYYNEPAITLAKKIIEKSSFQKVFFCNSGTEANEAAFKFARKYSYYHFYEKPAHEKQLKNPPPHKKYRVLAFNGGFHGRTMGALSLTYKQAYKTAFQPLVDGVTFLPYNDVKALKAAFDDEVCGVIVEPVQGEAGVFPATKEFLQTIRSLCDKHKALMICDEVQTGLGRLGHLWAHEQWGVQPDLLTLAKPLGNGLPIGACLLKQHVADVLKPGDHGSTFAANPLVCHVAAAVFDKLSDASFLQNVRANSRLLVERLKGLQEKLSKDNASDEVQITAIRAVNDEGFLIGVDLNVAVKNVIVSALEDHALVMISGGENTLRLAPPLIVSDKEIDEAVNILEKLFSKVNTSKYQNNNNLGK